MGDKKSEKQRPNQKISSTFGKDINQVPLCAHTCMHVCACVYAKELELLKEETTIQSLFQAHD